MAVFTGRTPCGLPGEQSDALYPETGISVHVAWGFKKQNTAVMNGKSIINKNSNIDIGALCLKYGGGHRNAGTCQIDNGQ